MGLIKAAVGAVGSTLQDQWKEVIRCDNLPNDLLMIRKTTPTGVITKQSSIIVGPGQCAVIYDNGRILDATAEEGMYTFDESSSPSFFAGQFGEVFKEMWQRFTYGGATAKEQSVIYFNIKEIIDNKFGTKEPIVFQDWSHPIPNQMTNKLMPMMVNIRCFGTYTFRIANPAIFLCEIAGLAKEFRKSELETQMRTEIMAIFQNVANELGDEIHQTPVLQLPSQTDEIREMMDEKVFDEPMRKRGMEIIGFSVESVSLDEESKEKIEKYELSSNAYLQQGKLVDAYANAVQSAAQNANGPGAGFMGLGIVNMESDGMTKGAATGPWNSNHIASSAINLNNQTVQKEVVNNENKELQWQCDCGNVNSSTSKFCDECGKPKNSNKICPKCNMQNEMDAKFCRECGQKF